MTDQTIGVRRGRAAAVRSRLVRWIGGVVALVVAYFIPTIFGGSLNIYDTVVTIAIFSVMVYGVDIMLSYLGEVSLGHTAMWALSGYTTAMVAVHLGLSAWLTLLASVASCLILAAVLGLAVYRSRAFIWTLSTYAAAIVLSEVASHWAFVGGSDGIVGLPPLDLGWGPLIRVQDIWPVCLVLLVTVILAVARFRHSRLAQVSLMAHMNPDLAATMGVNVSRARYQLLIVSSIPPALGGWLYAYYRSYVSPDLFGTFFLILMLTAAAVVGRRVLLGPVIGVTLIISQQNLASFGTNVDQLILGAVLVIVLTLWPAGLAGAYYAARDGIGRLIRRRRGNGGAGVDGGATVPEPTG